LLAHIKVPKAHPFTPPLIYAVPVQLIAYHTAVFLKRTTTLEHLVKTPSGP
jgi:glucosamine 6-phosphate synthetase-like amidotransferase/phosphosugar isomerase protein